MTEEDYFYMVRESRPPWGGYHKMMTPALLARARVLRKRAAVLWQLQRAAFDRILRLECLLLRRGPSEVDGHTRAYRRMLDRTRKRCQRIEGLLARNGV